MLTGMSGGWWRSHHNRHHAMPQRLKHDIDLETMPMLAWNAKVLRNPKTDNNFFTRNQAWLYLTLDSALVIFLWKFYVNPFFTLRTRAWMDGFFMLIHFYIFLSYFGLGWYLFASYVASTYMMSQFALSHTHLPVVEEPKHWVEYCLSHTVDIEPSWWCDWIMGYLNYQIVRSCVLMTGVGIELKIL
jgi:fatty acid desaturase 2 (delta-6 desaturase)